MKTLPRNSVKKSYQLLLGLILYGLASTLVFAQELVKFNPNGSNTVDVMQVLEVDFISQLTYTTDFTAYMDVDVWVDLTGPNDSYRIPVFWDGGNEFRARLVATSKGTWNWSIDASTVINSDQGFIGKSGSFTANDANVSTNANNHGFIRVAANNRTLEYADGTDFFYTGDTSWTLLTEVFHFDDNSGNSGISFKQYISDRKAQGYNGVNIIASFPDDTYLAEFNRNRQNPNQLKGLWNNGGTKVGPDGLTPFDIKPPGTASSYVTDAIPEADYKKINPAYWLSVDEKMEHLALNGFVTFFETIRRHERWPYRTDTEKNAFYNYVRYLWARYGCYNMIFSWEHHDYDSRYDTNGDGTKDDITYERWVHLVRHANEELKMKIRGSKMPYGQPRTAMSYKSSLINWNKHIPDALDIQNVSNLERNEEMHQWLNDLYDTVEQPAINLEPWYPGWGCTSCGFELNEGLNETTQAQMQMYGSVLSGGLAGHAWGDEYFSGKNKTNALANNDPYDSKAMGHLKNFILNSNHEYHRLIPAADKNLSFSSQDPNDSNTTLKGFVHTLSVAVKDNNITNGGVDEVEFALGFFAADNRTSKDPLPKITNLIPSENYLFEWYNVVTGDWISKGFITANNGELDPSDSSKYGTLDRSKSWAYRIRSENYINGEDDPSPDNFALRINTGGTATSYNSNSYVADAYYDTGATVDRPQTGLPEPLQSFRYSSSQNLKYDIPLTDGQYTVNLHFAELWFGATGGGSGGVGSRVFDVLIEGALAEDNLDVFAEAGANNSIVKTHDVTISDGVLNLEFTSLPSAGGERHPIINAIEILGNSTTTNEAPIAVATSNISSGVAPLTVQFNGSSSTDDTGIASYSWNFGNGQGSSTAVNPNYTYTTAGTYQVLLTVTDEEGLTDTASLTIVLEEEEVPDPDGFALRINTGGTATSYNSNSYVADAYYDTGATVDRPQTGLPEPLQSFRFGNNQVLNYNIPLDNGTYTVNLHFAELWFGATGGGTGGVGSRVFDVKIEGILVEDNLDVFDEAGANNSIIKTHSVVVTDGILNIDFSSLANIGGVRHPIINAIEILGSNTNNAPVAVATSDISNGTGPLTVQFSGSSSSDDNGIASYSWNFGNGQGSSTTANPNHTFTTAGTYLVELTVTDAAGLTDTTSITITVNSSEPSLTGVLHWPLDESTGVIANEASGNQYNGSLQNGLTFNSNTTSGQIGSAITLDGVDDHISLPDVDDNLQSGFTLSAWVKPSNAAGAYQGVIGTSTIGGVMMFVSHGSVKFKITKSDNTYKLVTGGTIQNNVWQMITCTYDGTDIKLYVNGNLKLTENYPGALKDRNSGLIGWSGWGNEYFQGAIDDARIYDTELTSTQINDLYTEEPLSISGYWPLDESSGVVANDTSGQGYHGTLENGLTFNSNTTSGQIGSAITLDGVDDHISLPDVDDNLQSGFTLSAWVKPSNAAGAYQGVIGTSTIGGVMMFVSHGSVKFKITKSDNTYKLVTGGTIQNNVWQMITCTYDGTDIKLYVNGNLKLTENYPGALKDRNSGLIGWSGWGNEYFQGSIDDARIYDTELTSTQINDLYTEDVNSAINLTMKISEIPQLENVAVLAVPNPTTGRFQIIGIPTGAKEIVVTDFSGRLYVTMKTEDNIPELDLSAFSPGMYMISISQNGSEFTFKVIKE